MRSEERRNLGRDARFEIENICAEGDLKGTESLIVSFEMLVIYEENTSREAMDARGVDGDCRVMNIKSMRVYTSMRVECEKPGHQQDYEDWATGRPRGRGPPGRPWWGRRTKEVEAMLVGGEKQEVL